MPNRIGRFFAAALMAGTVVAIPAAGSAMASPLHSTARSATSSDSGHYCGEDWDGDCLQINGDIFIFNEVNPYPYEHEHVCPCEHEHGCVCEHEHDGLPS
ncbi:hypothetical protein [Kitasatospora kifunensis]|uniref:Secreted protein n=1 Tax=Kitasatospora kifunensis TaxID=58351 RepID=A0A7W7W021_KITKI|nr:hypothetical protein [Kitasatospora kifunensis]MBB4928215.1 hypothetical protein [Kitasatospora kifunensis]